MATGTELALPEELRAAAETIVAKLKQGQPREAERAMALYVPRTQALIVRASFVEALRRRPGESQADALDRAGREAERVLDTVPTDTAPTVVAELDTQVLGALVSSAAGEAHSTVAQLVDSDRLEDILASDLELWTVQEWRDAPGGTSKDLVRKSGINVRHLVHVLWTILQTDDERASSHLRRLNPDLVAFPVALALLERTESDDGDDEHPDEQSGSDDFLASLRVAEEDGPSTLGFADNELTALLDVIYRLLPETYYEIIVHARDMDLERVREQLQRDAAERASGEDAAPSTATDEMFAPLDPPTVG
ncbi:MAG: hypothetical protein Q7R80_03335 [bacterium]|nr:hypothetical protein [bacterium]